MVFLVNLIATVGFWCGSFFYFNWLPLSIFAFFNAKRLIIGLIIKRLYVLIPLSILRILKKKTTVSTKSYSSYRHLQGIHALFVHQIS
jgi:ABC-type transport system involved in cytochrome bd biosynthesis fused ATPase/permease subunit